MSRGPLTALLAVLAVAGYQNRDKIAEMLRGLQAGQTTNPDGTVSQNQGGLGDLLGGLTKGPLGNIFGGHKAKGTIIGAAGGAAAGAVLANQTAKYDACIPSGGRVTVRLDAPMSVQAVGSSNSGI